ncbi:MAG: hypothetical protein DSZ23_03980 [Thermodesulfatator sp.]|nr:MAG: hypothetical protein DSZ23_03980 [Thermodesulfatator sp.]
MKDRGKIPEDCNIITRDALVITYWGEVRFRHEDKKQAGMLWTRARTREVAVLIENMDKDISAIRSTRSQLEKDRSSMLSRITDLKTRLRRLKNQRMEFLSEKQQIEAGIERIQDKMELQEFEREEAGKERTELEQELLIAESELALLVEKEREAEKSLVISEKAFHKIKKKRKKLRDRLQHLSVERAKLDTEINSIGREIKRLREQAERSVDLQEDLEREIATLDQKELEITKEMKKTSRNKQALVDKEAVLLKDLQKQEEMLEQFLSKRAAQEGEKRQLLSRLSEVNNKVQETELELSRVVKEKEHLEEMCLSSFGMEIHGDYEFPTSFQSLAPEEVSELLHETKRKLDRIGPVNLTAIDEYEELKKRLDFLREQEKDLRASVLDIEQAIDRIDRRCRQKFKQAIGDINSSLEKVFPLLFDGGTAALTLDSPGNVLESGVELAIEIPGKRIKNLNLLSGGEKALSALALIFSIFFIKPSPFCLLDEVDAPLDEANTERFNKLVRKISSRSQVVLVTHNQRVMETADTLYGVTMEEKGISKLISVSLV